MRLKRLDGSAEERRRSGGISPSEAVLLVSAGGFAGLYLLFAAVPFIAAGEGGRLGAGAATAAFMGTTVAVQAALPRLLAIPPHRLLAASLLLLGVPAALYAAGPALMPLLLLTALRGAGFGILTVVSTTLVSAYAPAGRRGAALGLYGLATSLTGVIAPSVGLLILQSDLAAATYWLGAALPLAALAALIVLRRNAPEPEPEGPGPRRTLRTAGRDRRLVEPALLFFPCALAYGGMYTFLPLATDQAAAGLLVFGAGFAGARFACGRLADRVDTRLLVLPLLALAGGGTLATAFFRQGAALTLGAVLAGMGIGGMATVSLVRVMSRVPTNEHGLASVVWNLTFDAGIAAGGLGLGLVAQISGYPATFLFSSSIIWFALAAAITRRDLSQAARLD